MQPFLIANREQIAELCRKHHVRRLSVFGSAARDDFDERSSDVDVLVDFSPSATLDFIENFASLRAELERLFHHPVDLLREGVVRNPYRLRAIESNKVDLYAA
ncbi:MAG: nucleotidyltransferase domain-containing protein [Acidobacteriota bacterium]